MERKICAFTSKEKLLLISLVHNNNIVKNKKTDSASVQKKQAEWEKIANNFNSQEHIISTPRTSVQLKKLWNNLKQRKKKATLKHNNLPIQPWGGPSLEDPILEAVSAAAPDVDIVLESLASYQKQIETLVAPGEEEEETSSSKQPMESAFSSCTKFPAQIEFVEARPASETTSSPVAFLDEESNLRIKKIKQGIEQQKFLHRIRCAMELETLKKTKSERRRAEAEEELAKLKLQKFKTDNCLL